MQEERLNRKLEEVGEAAPGSHSRFLNTIAVWRKRVKMRELRSIEIVALVMMLMSLGCAQAQSRDARYWPFSAASAWNSPIGNGAVYATVPNWSSLSGGFNPTAWTVSVGLTTTSNSEDKLYVNTGTTTGNYAWLAAGKSGCNISAKNATTLLSTSTQSIVFEANPYSTIGTGSENSQTIWPASYNPISADYSTLFYIPSGLCASPDTDGLLAVVQPNGWVMEAYEGITTASGDLIAGNVAGYYDLQGDGSGWQNGRRASMVPAIAGLIRTGEVKQGNIPHALAATLSPTILTEEAAWPAYAFDTNSGYTGTLPMGSLMAIPPSVNLSTLGLTASGLIVATAAQNYGVYIVDRGGTGGITFQVQYEDNDATFSNNDATIIAQQLQQVTNNSQTTPGGGGTEFRAPAAPPFSNCDSCTYSSTAPQAATY
jgi:hypothetical protein